MTTEQIKAQCDSLLSEDAKATPAPWTADTFSGKFVWAAKYPLDKLIKIYTGNDYDQTMITQARDFAPRAARALKIALDLLDKVDRSDIAHPACNCIACETTRALAAIAKEFEK